MMLEALKEREPNQWYYFYRDGGKPIHCGQPMQIHKTGMFCRCKNCQKVISLKPYTEALLSPRKREAARLLHNFQKAIAKFRPKKIYIPEESR